ncbi:MAG: MarR family transcriptional regulator [Coriobacteriales bacterium]|jgi:hypothetical protein|nr:MarR family transcriptional regulator [Coriobacteriales bacterium]
MADESSLSLSLIGTRARIAVYDDLRSSPRIIEIESASIPDFIESIASTTYSEARALGGSLPYTVIREIAENFIHADFKECAVSLLNHGNTISFSDQGPGIEKKLLVQQPGVTSATADMKRFIKGVGSGFPIVKEYLQFSKGHLSITDNALEGVVITLSVEPQSSAGALGSLNNGLAANGAGALPFGGAQRHGATDSPPSSPTALPLPGAVADPSAGFQAADYPPSLPAQPVLDEREKRTLLLVAELGAVGPNDLVKRLSLSAPTVSRLLKSLERRGFLEPVARRKRILSNAGLYLLQEMGLQI